VEGTQVETGNLKFTMDAHGAIINYLLNKLKMPHISAGEGKPKSSLASSL
jgi:hypothetical protein